MTNFSFVWNFQAAINGFDGCLRALCEAGANKDLQNTDGNTALMLVSFTSARLSLLVSPLCYTYADFIFTAGFLSPYQPIKKFTERSVHSRFCV